jgi:hypothetical protein
MIEAERSRNLPDLDRLSVLAATILLAYALARFIDLPSRDLYIQLPGLFIAIPLNVRVLISVLIAGITASGADWLLRDHPACPQGSIIQHWILPALTAWVIGFPLFQLPIGPVWWSVFAVGGALLLLVLVAEYIAIDPSDARYALAAAGLTSVSFTLFLTLAIALRSSGARLFWVLPAVMLAAGLVSLRALHIRLHGQWRPFEVGAIMLIVGQLAAALHYWPLTPISYGLALLGPAYALTSLIGSLVEGEPARQAILEPGLVLLIMWGAALWIR